MTDSFADAVRCRLTDLIAVAGRLQARLDGATTFPMARLAIDADEAVGRLERHAEALETARQATAERKG